MNADIVAYSVVEIISQAFRRNPGITQKCFRVKNLHAIELVRLVAAWKSASGPLGLGDVKLVVAEDLGGQVPPQYVAEPGRSITYYRNHNRDGLIYLEAGVQSDEQGLQNLFTLRDSNFLDGSFDDYAGSGTTVPGLIVKKAWELVVRDGTQVPSLLLERVLSVLRLVHPDIEPVPMRSFVGFAAEVCAVWAAYGSAIDGNSADRLVGQCLCRLDMFPDVNWRSNDVDARIKRRLELNSQHADLLSAGVELETDEVQRVVAATNFVDEAGVVLHDAEMERYRQLCSEYARAQSEEVRRQIPYAIFEQLFKRDAAGLKLGDRVRLEITEGHSARLSELSAADVVSGLNARLQSEAERFLGLVSPEGLPALVDLLSNRTRRAVERLAAPAVSSFFNPAIELVRIYQRMRHQDDSLQPARIELALVEPNDPANAATGLFTFLFGSTLAAISEGLKGMPGACEVSIAPALLLQRAVPILEEERADDDESEPVNWEPLALRITVKSGDGAMLEEVEKFWEPRSATTPYLAMFWLLAAAPDSLIWQAVGELWLGDTTDVADWTSPFIQRVVSLSEIHHAESAIVPGQDHLIDDLLSLRRSLRDILRADGLAIDHINSFLDGWKEVLAAIRLKCVPDGARPASLEAFLGNDTVVVKATGRRLMLPLHPIRLRWVSRYLERCAKLATSCLDGKAGFTMGEGEQYLDWLEGLTPHEAPPTTTGQSGELLFARSELAWFEDFAPLERVTADVSVDIHALDAISARIRSYLEAHPYKVDGLSLLVLLPPSDNMPAELIRQVARGALSNLRVSLTVAAPKNRWEKIARFVEGLPGEERSTSLGRLFPARDLAFIEFTAGEDLQSILEGQVFDIAVVTHVLQESVVSQQNTEPPAERAGAFNPLVDRPIRLASMGDGGSISIVMRPRDPDYLLETWGTLVVRSNRCRPVSPSQPENTDFVELRVNFQDSARVFNVLHHCSHWVVTLERHISREQIESVEAGAPDVLSIETGVGANGLNTLIVSSRSGRALIEARLSRKLHKLIPEIRDGRVAEQIVVGLSQRIYEETRHLSPHLALKAMGVARVTEEILGLCIARRVADKQLAVQLTSGLSAWLSLDEHAAWFGGSTQVRADMCRISFERAGSGLLEVDVLVLEGKLRQAFDPYGISQVKRTTEFFQAVLASTGDAQGDKVDAEMWRERILSAIENTAAEARTVVEANEGAVSSGPIPDDIRQLFREGKYVLNRVEGLYSVCLWEAADPQITVDGKDGVQIVRSTRAHILDLISRPADLPTNATNVVREVDKPVKAEPSLNAPTPPDTCSTAPTNSSNERGEPAAESTVPPEIVPHPVTQKGMDSAALRRMYDEVLACFASHNVAVSAASAEEGPYIEGPASVLFKVRAGVGVDPKKLFEKAQALKLRLELDQEQSVSFDIDRGFVTIDVPKRAEHRYFVNAADMWRRWTPEAGNLSVPIGEDRFGELVSINFSSSNSPHLLVAGTTGSGKSEALNAILFGLVRNFSPSELKLLLVDPKGTELLAFDGCAHLERNIGWDDTDALALLKLAVDEMQRRYSNFRAAGKRSLAEFNTAAAKDQQLPWWLIVLDEYADLTSDPQAKKDIESELKRLAQKARAAGIHVVLATQKPSAEVISTNLRSNLPAQLALRVKSGTESRVILDEAGAESLNGKGDALLKADGKLTRVQCARVERADQVVQPI